MRFLEAMGWNGPNLQELAGRDLTLIEKGQERRGPIAVVRHKPIYPTKSLILSFYVDWVALQGKYGWLLEDETEERLAWQINTENQKPQIQPDGSLEFWKAKIHKPGDNLKRPDIPVLRKSAYLSENPWNFD
jgi:hypothetical protein